MLTSRWPRSFDDELETCTHRRMARSFDNELEACASMLVARSYNVVSKARVRYEWRPKVYQAQVPSTSTEDVGTNAWPNPQVLKFSTVLSTSQHLSGCLGLFQNSSRRALLLTINNSKLLPLNTPC